VRSCIAKGVISPANDRAATQERGASAPRGANKRERNGNPHTHTPSAVCPRMALVSADAHLPTHGGLTPAALATVRSCIAKGGLSPANDRAATQERGASAPRGRPSCETQRTGGTQALLCNRIRTSDWEKADSQRQRLHRGPLRSKPPEVEPFHTPGETDRCVFTPYIPRQPRLRGPAIHLPKPLAALLRHIFGMAGVKATLRNWGGGYNGMLSRVP
jgi:hypothetical protein